MLDHFYIRRSVRRRQSRSAFYAPYLGWAAVLVLLAGSIAHRFGVIEQPELVLCALVAVVFALLALGLCVKALYNLWRSGDGGGRRAFPAAFPVLMTLVPVGFLVGQILGSPRLHDISTDLEAPVQFNTVMENLADDPDNTSGNNAIALLTGLGLGDLVRHNDLGQRDMPDVLRQIAAYPEVIGRDYDSAQDHVLKAVLKVLKDQGMVVDGSYGVAGEDMDVSVEATAKTMVLGLRSDVVVRLRDDAEKTLVEIRSVSRYGQYDLGFNAHLIEEFFAALDLEMRNVTPDSPEE